MDFGFYTLVTTATPRRRQHALPRPRPRHLLVQQHVLAAAVPELHHVLLQQLHVPLRLHLLPVQERAVRRVEVLRDRVGG